MRSLEQNNPSEHRTDLDIIENSNNKEEDFEFDFCGIFKVKWKRLTMRALIALIILLLFLIGLKIL